MTLLESRSFFCEEFINDGLLGSLNDTLKKLIVQRELIALLTGIVICGEWGMEGAFGEDVSCLLVPRRP